MDLGNPQTRVESLLMDMLGQSVQLYPPQTRVEEILWSMILDTDYNKNPQTRVEALMLELKEEMKNKGKGAPVEYLKLKVTEEIISISDNNDLLAYGEQSTTHYVGINHFDLTTYDGYADFISYDDNTGYFTVLADFTGIFHCWVENYKSSSGYPTGALYYNDNQAAYYTSNGNAQGSTGGTLIKINCKVGDTFYIKTPTDAGWAKQYIKVYKENE